MRDSPPKLKLEKVDGPLIILFYVSPSYPPVQSHFKENAKTLSKNLTTQENITISRQTFFFKKKKRHKKKTTTLQQVTGGKIPNLVLNKMLEIFVKIPALKKILEF